MARNSLILFLLLVMVTAASVAQNTNGSLEVKHEDDPNTIALFQKLEQTGNDTNRVNTLIKISHVYWYQKTANNNGLDSCLLFAIKARDLSLALHYVPGSNEANFMICRSYIEKNNIGAAKSLAAKVYGEERARLLLSIGEFYVFQLGPDKDQLGKAFPVIMQARKTSDSIHSNTWLFESLMLLGKYHFKKGEIANGKKAIMEIISSYDRSKNYEREGHFWSELGVYMPETDSTYRDKKHSHEMAIHYYLLANNKKDAAYSLRDLAVLNANHNQPDSAERQLLRVVAMLKSIHEKITFTTYFTLGDFYRFTGQFDKALYYALEAMKTPALKEKAMMKGNQLLGDIYNELGDIKSSIRYYQLVLDYDVPRNEYNMFVLCYYIANGEVTLGNPKKGMQFLSSFIKAHPPDLLNHKELIAACFGNIYNAMGNYDMADKYYTQMLQLDKSVQQERGTDLGARLTLTGSGVYYTIGKFYTERKRYKEGKFYLLKSLQDPQYFSATNTTDTYLMLFKADSALGNYIAAIKSFERHKMMNDSIYNAAKSRQISELSIKYETEQKTKDIKLLKNTQQIQRAELQRTRIVKNITFGGLGLIVVVAGLAYNGYRNKQRSNRILQAKQAEINEQNSALQTLISDKDKLLTEKDWLLKEVHHRVKNNLQIVMSLLSTQSAYLQNNDALEAIRESQNRVQTISLIHQKLYSTNNVASISMPAYIADLISYLADGFDSRKRKIKFEQVVEEIKLDLTQAVPLGLILNEAITNAIKYAFTENGGEVIVALQLIAKETVLLNIADNGKGLPADFDIRTANSLGMEMMKALSKQLGGSFEIKNQSGTVVSIEFQLEHILSGNRTEDPILN